MKESWPDEQIGEGVVSALRRAARLRYLRSLNEQAFQRIVSAIAGKELSPHGLSVIVRLLPNGTIRFLIKGRLGVCEMIDCQNDGECENDGSGSEVQKEA